MSGQTKIKICGLSKPDHVDAANRLGVELAGFVFVKKSPRHVSQEMAAALAGRCNPQMERVALLVNPDDEALDHAVAALSPHRVQLHGEETPARVAEIKQRTGLPIIKALPVATEDDVRAALDYADMADWFLFDAKPPEGGLPGGNGEAFDWHSLSAYDMDKPYLLAGGLSAENVSQALAMTGAPMVDISSSVEAAPGEKDATLMQAFVEAVRANQIG